MANRLAHPLTVDDLCNELGGIVDEFEQGGGLTPKDILHIFSVCEAGWVHSGNSEHPHAELTSGLCSNGFFDTLRVLRYTQLCDMLAEALAHKLIRAIHEVRLDVKYDWPPLHTLCVGSDHAGAVFSYAVARHLSCMHDFTEKRDEVVEGKKIKRQVWERFPIEADQEILQVEELMTTAGTFEAVRAGLRASNPDVRFMPIAGVLVHRSDVWQIEDTRIVALGHYNIQTWDPKDCPLCAAGSKRVRPKQNWAELTGKA